jgi:hypothetical protein
LCCTGEAQEEEICSPYVGILVERGFETSVAESFVLGLFAGELGSWDELLLTSLLQTDSLLTPLVQSLKQCGAATTLERINSASYVRLPADWDSYLASLPGQRRYFVRRTQRDLEAWLGKEGGERFASTRAELKQGRDILYDLHRQRWRAEGKDGVFDAPRFAKFHEAIMGAFIENGEAELELCWMERAGVPFAVLFNIIYNGRVYFYQSGLYSSAECKGELVNLDHAVLAVGYNLDEGYIVIRNSWSSHWGEGGYARMQIKGNTCGFATLPTYAIAKAVQ